MYMDPGAGSFPTLRSVFIIVRKTYIYCESCLLEERWPLPSSIMKMPCSNVICVCVSAPAVQKSVLCVCVCFSHRHRLVFWRDWWAAALQGWTGIRANVAGSSGHTGFLSLQLFKLVRSEHSASDLISPSSLVCWVRQNLRWYVTESLPPQ